jgi:hypothetical protein
MTVYARSDVASVALSAAHGGCGKSHSRPAPGGEPVEVWGLTCPSCEDHLRSDSLWSSTATSIPETPDEVASREANEKRTSREQQERNVDVMEKLGTLPDAMRAIGPDMAQALLAALAPFLAAAQNASPAPSAVPLMTPEPEGDAESTSEPEDAPRDIESLSTQELKDLAKRLGLPVRRSREDQMATLKEHFKR